MNRYRLFYVIGSVLMALTTYATWNRDGAWQLCMHGVVLVFLAIFAGGIAATGAEALSRYASLLLTTLFFAVIDQILGLSIWGSLFSISCACFYFLLLAKYSQDVVVVQRIYFASRVEHKSGPNEPR